MEHTEEGKSKGNEDLDLASDSEYCPPEDEGELDDPQPEVNALHPKKPTK